MPIAEIVEIAGGFRKSFANLIHLPKVIRNKRVTAMEGLGTGTNQPGDDSMLPVAPAKQDTSHLKRVVIFSVALHCELNGLRQPYRHALPHWQR